MGKIKDKIYDRLVKRNECVRYEYERYVREHLEEHRLHRFRHIKLLLKLNWFYRVKKADTPYLYWDVPFEGNLEKKNLKQLSEKEVSKEKRATVTEKVDKPAEKKASPQNEAAPAETKTRIQEPSLKLVSNCRYLVTMCYGQAAPICNVYRCKKGEQFKFLKQVYNTDTFFDEDISLGTEYQYRIKISFDGVNYSCFSNVVSVVAAKADKYDRIFGQKKLFRDGAESTYKKRMTPMNFAKMLMRYETISFDIFDTLILRPFDKPSDLFMLVGQELQLMDFCEIRIKAEEEARKRNAVEKGNREVNLNDIYRIIERKTGVSAEKGIRAELCVEMDTCFANPYMLRVYKLLLAQNKRIVATSDMYMSSAEIRQLLDKCGYSRFDEIIVSNEYNMSKRRGNLYDILITKYKNDYDRKLLIHVGDKPDMDVKMARSKGIEAYLYEGVNDRGNRFRAEGMSYLVGSAYRGITNAWLHNGINQYSPYYEVGYVYAGIYILGFCQWIHERAREKGISKILFLAREGDIYQRAFLSIYNDIDTQYVLWSRVPVVKTAVNYNRHPFLLQLVHHKANAIYKSQIETLFRKTGIEALLKYLADYNLHGYEYICPDNEMIVEKLLIDHWNEVCECYQGDQQEIKQYLEAAIAGHEKVAVVDVGWSGNNVLQIKKLVEEVYRDKCEVTCMLAAAREVNSTYMASMIQNREVETYIFSNVDNRFLHQYHQETNNRLNSFFFETLTQSCSPTFLGFKDGKFLYDIPEVENYEHNKEIHKGILDFVSGYYKMFSKYPFMLNISGSDAYMPFRQYVSDLSWIRKYFSEYVFGRDLFATQEEAKMETVREVMEKAKV